MLFSIAVVACGGGGGSAPAAPALPAGYVAQGGLTWMPVTFADSWANANAYCANTTLNGQTGWRMPTQAELSALVSSGAIPSIGWSLAYTWSSTAYVPVAGYYYIVSLYNGGAAYQHGGGANYVSCVRGSISATATTTAQSLGVGVAMSFSPLTPIGGATPYTYSYTGTLPAGLSFNTSTGAVTGTPTTTYATANLVFSVKDANNVVASTTSTVNFTVSLFIPSATATTTAQSLSVGTAMTSFSPLTPSGGAPPYIYSYTGTLPAGLSFNTSTGAVTGTPTATYATASLVFSVKDANNLVASTTSTVNFTVVPATSATATTTAQNLIVGTPMASFSPLTPSGGAPLYLQLHRHITHRLNF